jgi:hypothetical protein
MSVLILVFPGTTFQPDTWISEWTLYHRHRTSATGLFRCGRQRTASAVLCLCGSYQEIAGRLNHILSVRGEGWKYACDLSPNVASLGTSDASNTHPDNGDRGGPGNVGSSNHQTRLMYREYFINVELWIIKYKMHSVRTATEYGLEDKNYFPGWCIWIYLSKTTLYTEGGRNVNLPMSL